MREQDLNQQPGAPALVHPRPNQPILLNDLGAVWMVEQGSVDVFMAKGRDNEPVGRRRFLFRIGTGKGLFGIDPDVHPGFVIFACAVPDTVLLQVAVNAFRTWDLSHRKQLIEEWICQLAATISTKAVSAGAVQISARQKLVVPAKACAVLPREEVLWVRHLHGGSRFLSNSDWPRITGSTYFPLTRAAWFEAEPGSELVAVNTETALTGDLYADGFAAFHRLVIGRLSAQNVRSAENDRKRLEDLARSDEQVVGRSLEDLASSLNGQAELQIASEDTTHPLLLACKLVGKRVGIEVQAHPDIFRSNSTAISVAAIAKASGFKIRRVVLNGSWWKEDGGPLLAFTESDGEPVALLPSSATSYTLCDPSKGTRSPLNEKTAAGLSPYAYVFYRPLPARALRAMDLIRFGVETARRELWVIILMGMVAGVLGILPPIATGILFDTVIPTAERTQMHQLAALLIANAIAAALFTLARSFAVLRLEGKMDASLQSAVWSRLLSLPVPFFRNYAAGDLAIRSMSINSIRQVLTGTTISSILSGIFSLFNVLVLFYYSWRMALVACGLIAIAFSFWMSCGYLRVRCERELNMQRGKISGMVLQFIDGIAKFRVSGTERRVFAVWAREFAKQKRLWAKGRTLNMAIVVFQSAYPVMTSMAIFYAAIYFMTTPGQQSTLSTGEFLAFLSSFNLFLNAALQLSSSLLSTIMVVPMYERAAPIFRQTPEVDATKRFPGSLSGAVEINHLSFRYGSDMPAVLREFSMSVKPGQFVAVVGPSGSGKSTLLRLLLGFESPETGAIYYDGQDLAGLDIQAVRQQLGVVLQNGRLLSGDILTNIVGSRPLTLDDAWEAARMAGLEADLKAMPMGMHTMVSEGGRSLSGGQRQRLMIARAIVAKPRIVLFDEATSALDNQTQSIVNRSLDQLQATRIVIAHRLSTVMNADRIIVVDKGAVVESGTYHELIERNGIFAELAKRQIA